MHPEYEREKLKRTIDLHPDPVALVRVLQEVVRSNAAARDEIERFADQHDELSYEVEAALDREISRFETVIAEAQDELQQPWALQVLKVDEQIRAYEAGKVAQ